MTETNQRRGPVVIDLTESRFERVHSGKAAPEEAKRYFREVVLPASHARRETVADWARDATTTEKGDGMELYERVLQDLAEKGTTTVDLSDDDVAFEVFASQSGLNDLIGREPGTRTAADLSAPVGDEEEGADFSGMSDSEMWRSFVELSGFEEAEGADDAGNTADLSEDDVAGDGSSISDEEAWAQYQAAIGGQS